MMTSALDALKNLKVRITPARKSIFLQIRKSNIPLSAEEITDKQKVNKTTVYRELEFLTKNGLIDEVDFTDGKKRYESTHLDHHHHLLCLNCKSVKDVKLDEGLAREEEKIYINNKFKVVKHNLEFFGFCLNCQ